MGQSKPRPFACAGKGTCHDGAPAAQSTPPLRAQGGSWKRVAAVADVPTHGMKAFLVGGVSVLIAHTGDDYVAMQSLCPHEGVPLESGLIDGSTLTCLEHLWQFDIRTGAPLGEALEGLQTYPLKKEGDELYIAL